MDLSAVNLHFLRTHHWLKSPKNVLQLWLTSPAWTAASASSSVTQQRPRGEEMKTWTALQTKQFLQEADLEGSADTCYKNGMDGAD
eukprot:11548160-Karenia_brevis.AAC.1